MEFTYENDEGEDITVTFPSVKVVCPRCKGHGTHLHNDIGSYAYSVEEFQDSFDEEEQAEYFRHGGRYDVLCERCHGKNVVDEIDEEKCQQDPALTEAWQAFCQKEKDDADYERLCESERRFGC